MNFFEWSVDHVLGKKTNAGGAGSMGTGWTDHNWSYNIVKYTWILSFHSIFPHFLLLKSHIFRCIAVLFGFNSVTNSEYESVASRILSSNDTE